MRRLWKTVLAATLLGTSLAAPVALAGPAAAVSPPTITYRASAPYWAVVPISGTAFPGAQVQLFVRRSGDAHFDAGKTVTADESGNYGMTLRIIRTSHYYVRSNGQDSPRVTTTQYQAKCSVGRQLVDHMPLGPSRYADPQDYDFVALTASRGATWAGVTGRDSTLAVIVRRKNQPVKILHRYDYRHVSYEPEVGGSIQVAGITPQGAVVASVQARQHGSSTPRLSYVWVAGDARRLAGPSDWTFVQATGVSDDGTIVGTARVHQSDGHYVYRAVAWSHDGTHVVFEQATGAQQPLPVIDGQGDIAYIDRDGYVQVVAAHGGKHELRAYPLSVDRDSSQNAFEPEGASEGAIYSQVQQGDMTWPIPSGGGNDPIVGHTVGEPLDIDAVDSRGDSVVGYDASSSLRLVSGSVSDLPHQPSLDGNHTPGVGIASGGTVAFTSAKDDLPHLFRCSTHH